MHNFIFSLGSDVVFNISLPRKGIYYYSIFACDTDQADVYNNVISIKIRCSDVSVLQIVSGKINYFLMLTYNLQNVSKMRPLLYLFLEK